MESDRRKIEEAYLKAVDIGYSYHLAKKMEEFKSNPVLGYRTAGSKAEFDTGEFLKEEMERIGLSDIHKDELCLDSWEFEKAVLRFADRDGKEHEFQLGAYQTEFVTDGWKEYPLVYAGRGKEADYDGVDVTGLPEFKRASFLGRVFQDPMTGTTATMQIDENLALAARRGQHRGLKWGITKKEKAKFHELLKTLELGLEDRMTSKVGLLSGGQRQAVTLLMASLRKPKLLLLDEHTAALDPKTAAKVLELTDKIIEENHLTAMMVTHNMRDAIAHGNRLIMMNNGRVILNISGEEKKKLTVEDLLVKFEEVSGEEFDSDKALLG